MSGTPLPWGVYVHVPFCRRRCTYCDFAAAAGRAPVDPETYAGLVVREWEAVRRAQAPPGRPVSVYLGGGTPSLLPPAAVGRILEAVARDPGLAPGAEVTLEANPGTVTPASLAGYRAAGVNRLSLGVQAVQDRLLAALGRDHTAAEAAAAVNWARRAGFDNLNLDAIYGLPGQSVADWRDTLDRLLDWAPEHLSLYRLQVEEGTPLAVAVRRGQVRLPEEDATADMADAALARLEAAGFRRYEISNFARPGRESRHNRLYWELDPYLPLGAGAHGYLPGDGSRPGRRWWNPANLRRYRDAVQAGRDPAAGEERLDRAEEMREFLWLGLRQVAGVDPEAFRRRFGRAPGEGVPVLAELGRRGLLAEGSRLALSPRGLEVANVVFRALVDAEVH
ncbi:Heme chaperone HemW [Candidatus Hydrogenisulfobacillus filiaventi]|uniref:Heme chaperone HemW n=1 Tax=Candidatus Hydrogenisulfobacillus filiaventi TaxID=2707344 RepID=A0A6F8ZI18_9FIRM|nr:Heme chaperone HemW [Candidatus Hydrogenisulfobacillus filiaventi]